MHHQIAYWEAQMDFALDAYTRAKNAGAATSRDFSQRQAAECAAIVTALRLRQKAGAA